MEKLQKWADIAHMSESVRELFRSFFSGAEKLEKSIDPLAKNVLLTPGAQPTVPSALVERYKTKKGNHVVAYVIKKVIIQNLAPIVINKILFLNLL